MLRCLTEMARAEDGKVTVRIREESGTLWIDTTRAGSHAAGGYGLACDVGTTTVAVQFVEPPTGRVVASASARNARVRRGADILSRIDLRPG